MYARGRTSETLRSLARALDSIEYRLTIEIKEGYPLETWYTLETASFYQFYKDPDEPIGPRYALDPANNSYLYRLVESPEPFRPLERLLVTQLNKPRASELSNQWLISHTRWVAKTLERPFLSFFAKETHLNQEDFNLPCLTASGLYLNNDERIKYVVAVDEVYYLIHKSDKHNLRIELENFSVTSGEPYYFGDGLLDRMAAQPPDEGYININTTIDTWFEDLKEGIEMFNDDQIGRTLSDVHVNIRVEPTAEGARIPYLTWKKLDSLKKYKFSWSHVSNMYDNGVNISGRVRPTYN